MTSNPTLKHGDTDSPPPGPRPAASAIALTADHGARRIAASKRRRAQRSAVRHFVRFTVALAAVVALFAVPSGIVSFIGAPA